MSRLTEKLDEVNWTVGAVNHTFSNDISIHHLKIQDLQVHHSLHKHVLHIKSTPENMFLRHRVNIYTVQYIHKTYYKLNVTTL